MLQVSPGKALRLGGSQQPLLLLPPPVGASWAARGAWGQQGQPKPPCRRLGNTCSLRAERWAQPLGSGAAQGSTARAPAEPARPGWRQPSHFGEVVAAGARPKDSAGSTAREGDAQGAPLRSQAAVPGAAQPSRWQCTPARSSAGSSTASLTGRSTQPRRGELRWPWAANPPCSLSAPATGSRAPLPPWGLAKTPRAAPQLKL